MNVRRVVKWTLGVLLVLVVVGFLAFLYLIPPFTLMAPEAFSGPEIAAADAVKIDAITDPKTRALAEQLVWPQSEVVERTRPQILQQHIGSAHESHKAQMIRCILQIENH